MRVQMESLIIVLQDQVLNTCYHQRNIMKQPTESKCKMCGKNTKHTRSDSKVMRLIFSWLYWQYRSPLTWTAFDLRPSSILTCSGMAVHCLSVE